MRRCGTSKTHSLFQQTLTSSFSKRGQYLGPWLVCPSPSGEPCQLKTYLDNFLSIIIFEAQKALASLIAEEPENIEVDAGGSPPRTPASRRRAASLRSARSARSNFSQWSEESDEGIFAGGQHRLSKSCGGDLDTIAGSRTPNSIRKTRKEPRSVTDIDLADVAAARAIVASGSQSVTGTSVGGPAPRHVAGRASQPLPDSSSTSFDAHIYAVPGEESDGGEKAAKEPPPSAAGVNNTSRDSVASNGETDLWQQGGFFSPGQERSGTSIVNSRSRRVSAQGPPPPPPPEMVPRRQQQSQKGSGGPSVNLRKTPASHGDVSLNPHSRPASTSVSRPNSTYSVPGEVDSDSDAIEARVTTVASDSGISHASDTAKHSSSSTSEVFTSSVPGVYDNVGGLRSPSAGWSDPYDSEAKSVGNSPTYANIERQQSSVGTAGFEAVAIGSIRPDVTQAGQPGPPPPPVPPAGSHRRTKSGGSLENSGSVEVSPRRKRSATEVQPADIAAAWAKHQANVSSPRTVADQPLRPAPPPPSQAQSRPGHSRSRSRGSGDFIGFGGGTSPERQPSAMSMAGGMNQIRAANIPSGFGPGKDASGWSEHIQRAAVQ